MAAGIVADLDYDFSAAALALMEASLQQCEWPMPGHEPL